MNPMIALESLRYPTCNHLNADKCIRMIPSISKRIIRIGFIITIFHGI